MKDKFVDSKDVVEKEASGKCLRCGKECHTYSKELEGYLCSFDCGVKFVKYFYDKLGI